ncbi:helix-turn-helix transcriptional regulator [Micromonospora peucetia]|uniref:helix-turn-helix transcriptional regulator n=1 Tax=Micromonospora peucetia TaxID=47871 RepID=UPI00224E8642|nr:helix-turn-helix transcriptional regulator [Micromonospora peucetia]MCX4388211.1 helix-turn-helix transcriptional regulator [Micromonospora peucetia]
MDRPLLAEFLRSRRARVRPEDVGLPPGVRRRTPGLRREEVAQLAGISVDYYNRLEQARAPRPSRQVLAALGRALLLYPTERSHLFRLAGEVPDPPARPDDVVPHGLRHLLDRLTDTPAYVIDARYDLLAWNSLAVVVLGDPDDWAPGERNLAWRMFRGRPAPDVDEAGAWAVAARCVADLRAASGRYPDDVALRRLLAGLRADSPEFDRRWRDQPVCVRDGSDRIRLTHRAVGELTLDREALELAGSGQRLVVHTAAPGSRSAEALRLLTVIGTQWRPAPAS